MSSDPDQLPDPEPTRSDARRNRDAVLSAAMALLSDRPEASMREIAVASGVGRTTVYRHFPTREDLLEGMFETATQMAREFTARLVEGDPPLADVLLRFGREAVAIGDRYRFLQAHPDLRARALGATREHPQRPLTDYLGLARERGDVREDMPLTWMVAVIWAVTSTMVEQVQSGLIDSDDSAVVIRDTLLSAFAA